MWMLEIPYEFHGWHPKNHISIFPFIRHKQVNTNNHVLVTANFCQDISALWSIPKICLGLPALSHGNGKSHQMPDFHYFMHIGRWVEMIYFCRVFCLAFQCAFLNSYGKSLKCIRNPCFSKQLLCKWGITHAVHTPKAVTQTDVHYNSSSMRNRWWAELIMAGNVHWNVLLITSNAVNTHIIRRVF